MSQQFIIGYENWLQEYRKDKYNIWTKVKADNNIEYYLRDQKDWLRFKDFCDSHNTKVLSIALQYRSHSVSIDTEDTDGVYLVRSIIGQMGEQSKQAITIGKVYGDIVKKTILVTPELIEEFSDEDTVEECFEEALILYAKKKQARII